MKFPRLIFLAARFIPNASPLAVGIKRHYWVSQSETAAPQSAFNTKRNASGP
jgi:hypothetical protein